MQFPLKPQKASYFLTYVTVCKMDYQDKWITAHEIEVMWASTWTLAIKNMFFTNIQMHYQTNILK